ncbi:MOSC N-terminal beta barrel domain-containing protein [uncultured Methylibium sp.]|uniref:MOSC domain-containing protein n=1 Tax=uncultured Methylibium sp. TaxID=381093 RepID=UPI0025F70D2A|nr:MOSC N-terminal beta barrel domain-containing protein [uncultured Methylibium sp.]
MSDLTVTLASLHVYPIKSCAGVALDECLLIETGLEFDRAWMVVDSEGEFVSQRELPRMALVSCTLRHSELVLRAPGMLALHLALDTVEQPTRVRVWDDAVAAYDMGDLAARWFSDFLRQELRLVRFDPEQKRLSNRAWTGAIEAENAFSDGYPLLVVSQASLDGLNERLAAKGVAPATMQRFRPNLVLAGLDAHGEDHLDELAFDTADGPVRLKLVKPCPRCPIPNIDPATGVPGTEPGDTLQGYRADERVDGAISFGMNAVIVEGIERALRVGQTGQASIRF